MCEENQVLITSVGGVIISVGVSATGSVGGTAHIDGRWIRARIGLLYSAMPEFLRGKRYLALRSCSSTDRESGGHRGTEWRVAVARYPRGRANRVAVKPGIFIANRGGSEPCNITNHAASDSYPAWLPEGRVSCWPPTGILNPVLTSISKPCARTVPRWQSSPRPSPACCGCAYGCRRMESTSPSIATTLIAGKTKLPGFTCCGSTDPWRI